MPAEDDQDRQGDESKKASGSRKALGSQQQRVQFKTDEEGVKGLTKILDSLNTKVLSLVKSFDSLYKKSKQVNDTWKNMEAPSMGGGGGKTSAGGVPLNPDYLGRPGRAYGAARAAGYGKMAGGMAAGATLAYQGAKAAWAYGGERFEANTPYSLTSDRTGLMMRQMYGGTQLDYQSKWRQPLTGGLIGRGGIEEMLKLQTTMGINPESMLKGVEGIRVASGFGYSTKDATKMISALAQPGSSNLMTMMMGMGLYGPGGKANDPMDVVRNTVQRFGLTDENMVEGAFQPGSMTRANLSRAGVPTDMIDFVLQYAQQNVQFNKQGGQGMYDPASEGDRRLMGVDSSFAMEEQRTRMSEVTRSEKFYRRQVDNFAQLERNTQGLIEKFQALDEVLSGIIGVKANMQNKWYLRMLSKATFGTVNLGDSEHLRDSNMNSGFAAQLARMKTAADDENIPLTLVSGSRDDAEQERLFRERYHEDSAGGVSWNGKNWTLNAGASPAATPGQSLQGLGYAADLGPSTSYEWITANAARFGLWHGASFGEPWHVAPANITSASQVSVSGTATSRSYPSPTSPASNTVTSTPSSRAFASPDVHRTEGLSTSAAIKSWEDYGRSRTPMPAVGDVEGGRGTVTIAPTINLNGSGSAADADMLAKRVIHLIETSEAIRVLRRS